MIKTVEKMLKRCNKDKMRVTLGMVVAFLVSSNIFVMDIENTNIKNANDFSEIKEIFEKDKKIVKELEDGSKIIISFTDNKIIVNSKGETFAIYLNDIKSITNQDLANKTYFNLVNTLKNLQANAEKVIEGNFHNIENKNLAFGTQLIEPNKLGINSGVIIADDQGQAIDGIGINNGIIRSRVGQAIWDNALGINNGIMNIEEQGQYSTVGIAVNNGIINSNAWGQIADISLGINNGVINSKNNAQTIINGLGINNGNIQGNNVGQDVSENSIGINNGIIKSSTGQNSKNFSININTNLITSKYIGQNSDENSIGINLGRISDKVKNNSFSGLGQNMENLGINYGTVNAENGIAQKINNGLIVNNGVLMGNTGQRIGYYGTVINNGIIIADSAYESGKTDPSRNKDFYANGIALKRDEKGNLVLNNNQYKYNERVNIFENKNSTNKLSELSLSSHKVALNTNGYNIFVDNLKGKNNQLVLDVNLANNNSIKNKNYANTHITTAVAKDSTLKDNDSVIKVELTNTADNNSFTMDKSTIIGYFEKDGTLVDMTKNNRINLNDSVISAVGEGSINPIAIKVSNGTEMKLYNSVVNGKLVFEDTNKTNAQNNTLNLNSKYNGNDKKTYEDGTQFMTSVSDVEFKGKTNDTIVATIEENQKTDTKDENTKGFISIGNVNFGEGNDNLKLNFEDYKTGHLNIGGVIDFGNDTDKKDEDKIEFTKGLNTADDSLKSLVLLNNLLAQTKNLETLQLANENNSVVIGENGISLEFDGTLKGGTGDDTFTVKGNGSKINNVDGGQGSNTLKFEKIETTNKVDENQKYDYNSYVAIDGNISNFANIDINTNIKLGENATFTGIANNTLNLNNNSLILDINKDTKDKDGNIIGNALYNKNQGIIFKDMDKIVFDVADFNKGETILTDNQSIKENTKKITTNSTTHNIVIGKDGNIKVEISDNLPLVPIKPSKPIEKPQIPDNTPEVKPEIPMTPIGPSNPIIKPTPIKPANPSVKPSVPDITNPDNTTKPDTNPEIKPDEKPQVDSNVKYEVVPNYNYLNKIYQSVKDANAMDEMQKTTQLTGSTEKGIVAKTERESIMAQLEFYGKIFNSTPYAYSHKISKKTSMAITDEILSSDIKAKENEWVFGGKILGQNSDNKNEFYGRNLHGVDSGNSEVKVDTNISGAYAFGEYGIKEDAVLGFTVGGTKSSTDISGNSKLKGNAIAISTYAKKDINNIQLKAGLAYQHGFYDSTRTVSNAYQSMTVDKDYNDNTFSVFGGAKYTYSLGREMYLEPYFNMTLSHVKQDGISEESSKKLAIDVDKKDFTSIDTETGLDLVKKVNLSKGDLKLKAGTSVLYALDGYKDEYLTGRIKGSSKDFEMLSAESDRTRVKFKVSAEYELENGMSYNINGNYITSSNSKDYTVGVGIGYKF